MHEGQNARQLHEVRKLTAEDVWSFIVSLLAASVKAYDFRCLGASDVSMVWWHVQNVENDIAFRSLWELNALN
jgi:hypothetical protein